MADNNNIDELYRNKLFERYINSSKQFQRVFSITLGLSLFFFLMILFPYFSLKYEYSMIGQLNPISDKLLLSAKALDGLINDTTVLEDRIRGFHDIGIAWFNEYETSLKDLYNIRSIQKDFNVTIINSTLLQTLYEGFANKYRFNPCIYEEKIGTSGWVECSKEFIVKEYQKRTDLEIEPIEDQIKELANETQNQIREINSISDYSYFLNQSPKYFSILQQGYRDSNLIKLLNDSRDSLLSTNKTLYEIQDSLSDFTFFKLKIYTTSPGYFFVARDLEDAMKQLNAIKLSIEVSNNNLMAERLKIDSLAQKIAERLEQPSSPIGTLPTGFDQLVSIFPIALAGGYLICIFSLIDSMRFRRKILDLYKNVFNNSNSKEKIIAIAPLWLDRFDSHQGKILRFSILLLPVIIFGSSCLLILYSWTNSDISLGGEYMNRIVFGILYLVCGFLFVYGLIQFIKEYSKVNSNKESIQN